MKYIVASATKPDYEFDTYDEALECAQSMYSEGILAAIVTSDDHWNLWSVWKTGMTSPQVVGARSEGEAIVAAIGMTHDNELDNVQCN